MTNKELFTGLMDLQMKYELAGKTELAKMLGEAAAVIMAQDKIQLLEPKVNTSNGDPVATFFNNVVKFSKPME